MADFIKVADRMYEGASTDTKPTGVPNGSLAKETDTLMTYITYDHGVTWVVADERVRLTNEDGTFVDLPGEFASLITTITG